MLSLRLASTHKGTSHNEVKATKKARRRLWMRQMKLSQAVSPLALHAGCQEKANDEAPFEFEQEEQGSPDPSKARSLLRTEEERAKRQEARDGALRGKVVGFRLK